MKLLMDKSRPSLERFSRVKYWGETSLNASADVTLYSPGVGGFESAGLRLFLLHLATWGREEEGDGQFPGVT